jgi:hypothetical protein
MVSERITYMDFSRREIKGSKPMCLGCHNGKKNVKKAAYLATGSWVGSCLIWFFVWAGNDELHFGISPRVVHNHYLMSAVCGRAREQT